MMPCNVGCGGSKRTKKLLQFHYRRVGSQSLMDMVILARMAGLEVLGILVVVVVGHDAGNCRAPAAERTVGVKGL